MIALYIILGIIAAIILLFSVKITVDLQYDETFELFLKVLFLKFRLLPAKEKPKKEEKPKEEKEEKPKEEKKEESSGESFVAKFYREQGFDGVMQFLSDILHALNTLMGDIFKRSFVVEKLLLKMRISKQDAASTALTYGKTCAAVYPTIGYLCNNMRVRKYCADIQPDYLANDSSAAIRFVVSIRPIKLTNAVVRFGVRAVVAFVKTMIRAAKNKKSTPKIERNVES